MNAINALIDKLTASRIDVSELWARQAFIDKLMVTDISSNTYIQSTIGNWQSGSTITQTIELTTGWNWVSINVEGDPVQLLQAFKAGLGENGIVIKSFSSGSTDYYAGYGWYGTLDNIGIMNEQMYMVRVGANCTVELQGMPANPASHEITINPSWNWIGFPCAEPVAIQTALAGFDAQPGDVIKYKIGSSDYYAGYGWYGTIETLVPGQGYMFKSTSSTAKPLVFQTGAKARKNQDTTLKNK